jgi:hypothetical protein
MATIAYAFQMSLDDRCMYPMTHDEIVNSDSRKESLDHAVYCLQAMG